VVRGERYEVKGGLRDKVDKFFEKYGLKADEV
jgi:hypothetical protein